MTKLKKILLLDLDIYIYIHTVPIKNGPSKIADLLKQRTYIYYSLCFLSPPNTISLLRQAGNSSSLRPRTFSLRKAGYSSPSSSANSQLSFPLSEAASGSSVNTLSAHSLSSSSATPISPLIWANFNPSLEDQQQTNQFGENFRR